MIRNTFILFCIAFAALMVSCSGPASQKEEGLNISGTVNKPLSGLITLWRHDFKSFTAIDTLELDDQNNFSITLPYPSEQTMYRLDFYEVQAVNFLAERDPVQVVVDGNNPKGFSEVKGSPDTEVLNSLTENAMEFQSKMMELNGEMVRAQNEGTQEDVEEVLIRMQEHLDKSIGEVKAVVNSLGTSTGALFASKYITSDENFEFLDSLAMKFQAERPESVYTKNFTEVVDVMRKLAIGQVAPDFTLPNPDGEMVSLSSFRGNYVLVDFWAKWCKPCRIENPNVVKAYNRFHPYGFEVLGVSLDRNKSDWLQAIDEDNLTWTHVSDLKFWQSEVVPLYEIKGIPFAVLLDPEGKLLPKTCAARRWRENWKSSCFKTFSSGNPIAGVSG